MIIVKKPKIRFKGFTETWEQRKLDEVITRIGTGLNPRDNFTLNSGGENYYVTIKNFVHGHLSLDDNCDKVDDEALKRIQERSDLCVNDILFTSIGRIGDCYLIKKQPTNWNINESVFTLRPNLTLVEPEYIYHTIHSDAVLNQIINGITGSTFKSIKIADLKKVNIPVPSKAEQKQIAAFISIIDHLITLHQRKCENLKKLKKFMLQKMFPQNGENVPKIRFYNFTDTWEQRRLGNVFKEYSEKNHGELPALTIVQGQGTINRNESERNLMYEKSNLSSYKMVRKNDFIVHLRSFEGGLEIATLDGIISPAYHTLHGDNTDSRFYYSYFRSYEFINHGLVPHVYGIRDGRSIDIAGMKTILIPYTSFDEQKKIGNYIETIDRLITLHQSKCDNLKELKKYMLQNMFI